MKIVEVCAYYPPHIGGIEYVAKNVSEELVNLGHEVTVLTSTIGSRRAGLAQNGKLREVYLRSFEFAHTTVMPSLFFRLMKIEKSSVIHLHLSHVFTETTVWLAAKLRGIGYVSHYHMDVDVSGQLGFLYKAYKKTLLPFVIRGSKKVIALSDEHKIILANRYKVSEEKIAVIPNGVSKQYFAVKNRDFTKKPPRLLFVGRFAKQKNLPRLIEAVALLHTPTELHLVGDGEKREELESLVKKLALKNVYFDGPKSGHELVEAYANGDLFVLSSDREGMPLALLEAAASGLPIVASNVQGLKEYIKDNGVLVENPSPENFAKAIDALLQNKSELERLSRTSRTWAEQHEWSRITKQIAEVLS